MLVLSRIKNETIMIGDDIEITVVDVKGDTVRLGINAPRSIPVHRKEIYLAIQQENIEAAKSDRVGLERLGELLGGGGLGGMLEGAGETEKDEKTGSSPSAVEKPAVKGREESKSSEPTD